jgi:hypothetical protein
LVALVNPDNVKQDDKHLFPEEIGNNLPYAFQILALVYAAIGIIGSILTSPIEKDNSLAKALIPSAEKD